MPPNNAVTNSPQPARSIEERAKRTMNSGLQQNGISRAFVVHADLPGSSTSSLQSNGLPGLIDTAQFNREVERLKTFERWPVSFLSPSTMAAAGFYYLNRDDVVRCAFCGVEVGCWVEGDNPKEDHRRWSPSCNFVRNLPTGNVPIDFSSNFSTRDNGVDTCGRYGIELRDQNGIETNVNIKDKPASLEKLGIHKIRAPSFPAYATYDARLHSYEMWPIALKLKPNTLSEAGFFYTGKGDQTICFHCGGGLKDWEESDEPWMEHARWFSKCNFVLMIKGKEFVDEVCGKKCAEETVDKEGSSPSEEVSSNQKTSSSTPVDKSESKIEKSNSSQSISAPSVSTTISSGTLSDRNVCKICYTEEMSVVFLPCGHLVACVTCALSLTTCAVCRQPVTATVRAFLS
uniref:RING-type domain-containing protein n=1 Tax=Clastoptera arizonana TaxID=38151 RepID=A0A1B6CU38_9HEMI